MSWGAVSACRFVMLFTHIKHTLLRAPARVGFRVEEYHSATVFGEILQDTRPMMSTEDAMIATIGRSHYDLAATSCFPAPGHPQRNPVPDFGLFGTCPKGPASPLTTA